jgi:putative hydrolase of HD superfamily
MKTKLDKHTRNLLTEQTNPIIELFFEFAQLKNLYRQGWLKRDISQKDCENVADHSFNVALLGYMIAEEYRKDLDSLKVMRLGLFHEIGEIYAGDIIPADNINSEEKFSREYEAVKIVFSKFSDSKKYIDIWLEFERKTSPESLFVNQIDRLELALQTNLYERAGYTANRLEEFFPYVQERLTSPELKQIFGDLIRLRK